jgi:uncharacterized protein
VKGRLDPKTRVRRLHEIDLWEISIVTFPLLSGARLALASAASGKRENERTGEGMLWPARARGSRPVDPSLQRFHPERLFCRHPRLRFESARRLAV